MPNHYLNHPAKLVTFAFGFLLLLPTITCLAQTKQDVEPVKESSFAKSLEAGKFILPAKDGWWNWGMAPIYDEQGRLHIFNSAIPFKGEHGMGYWQSKSIINHYVGDSIEGPFKLVGTPFASDERTYHNPQISKVGDTYVLVFLWKLAEKGSLQSIGMATAKSLDGPWTENPRQSHHPTHRWNAQCCPCLQPNILGRSRRQVQNLLQVDVQEIKTPRDLGRDRRRARRPLHRQPKESID